MTNSALRTSSKLINPLLDKLAQVWIIGHWWSQQPSSGNHQIIANCSDLPYKVLCLLN